MTLPPILRAEAKRLGLTQRELADRAGLTQAQISHLLTGARKPSYESLRAILRGLGKSWGWLDRQGLDPRV